MTARPGDGSAPVGSTVIDGEGSEQPATAAARPADTADRPSRSVVDVRIDVLTYTSACETIARWAEAGESRYVAAASVNNIATASRDPGFLAVMNRSDLTTSDGMPLVWALRLLGAPEAERVCGRELTDRLCRLAASRQIPVGFYGGAPDVLDDLVDAVRRRAPELEVAYAYAPPFRPTTPGEDDAIREEIRASGARILFVGLGAPKQERWIAERVGSVPGVMIGVGAAFDFLAGRLPHAPAWMQRLGLEWLFRLVHEPRRLWKRYVFGNPRFVALFARQLIAKRIVDASHRRATESRMTT